MVRGGGLNDSGRILLIDAMVIMIITVQSFLQKYILAVGSIAVSCS